LNTDLALLGFPTPQLEIPNRHTDEVAITDKVKSNGKIEATKEELEYLKNYRAPADGIVPYEEVKKQAMMVFHLEGIPATAENVNNLLKMMRNESGTTNKDGVEGVNTKAVNNTPGDKNYDRYVSSGGRIDERSRGPCQLIPSTFRAYHDPRLSNDIFNVAASMAGAIKYCIDLYGYRNKDTHEVRIPANGY
jgi:hypothetical protein